MAMWQGGPWGYTWEGLFFKRVSEGWVFRSPISWWPFGLGPARHYLVNGAQKAQILRVMGRSDWRFHAMLVAAFLVGIVPLVVLHGHVLALWGDPDLALLTLMLPAALWAQGAANVFHSLALRSTLAGAPRASERITFFERLSVQTAMSPVGMLFFGSLLFMSAFGFLTYEALLLKPPTIGRLIFIGIGGLCAIYCFAMLMLKFKLGRSTG